MDVDDDGTTLTFDEVDMQDMIDDWSRIYADGVEVVSWYYDCRQATVILRLLIEENKSDT